MDSDGEDNPKEVPKMLNNAIKHPNHVVTSNRKREGTLFSNNFIQITFIVYFYFYMERFLLKFYHF